MKISIVKKGSFPLRKSIYEKFESFFSEQVTMGGFEDKSETSHTGRIIRFINNEIVEKKGSSSSVSKVSFNIYPKEGVDISLLKNEIKKYLETDCKLLNTEFTLEDTPLVENSWQKLF